MNTKKIDVPRFGKIAIDNKIATHMDIFEALKEQKRIDTENQSHQFIGDILIKMGVITDKQRDFILKEMRVPRFGKIAIDNGFATHMDVFGAIKEQKRIDTENQSHQFIGDILIKMDVITDKQRNFILAAQDTLREKLLGEIEKPAKDEVIKSVEESAETVGEAVEKETGYYLTVSEDKMNASICPTDTIDYRATLMEINELLQKEGVIYGIVDDKLICKYLEKADAQQKPWKIAEGKEPESGTDPEIQFFFETDPLKIGTMTEDGSIDWKDRGQIPQVREGDCIAEINPGRVGTPGKNIYGESVPPPRLNVINIKYGNHIYKSEDGLKIYSKIDGRPELSMDENLDVFSDLKISGDIGIETGHVDFDGHIDVSGSINNGYQVKGESLRCKEIGKAKIEITGDIVVMGRIFGANINSSGKLRAGHINRSNIEVLGDIAVENEIVDSKIETNGRCMIDGGTILSSEIVAKKGIKAKEIGTEVSKSSSLFVGVDHKVKRDLKNIMDQIAEKEMRRKNLHSLLDELKNKSDGINIKLGEIAQEQDRSMVQHRNLKEKMKESEHANVKDLMTKVEEAKRNLESKINQIDKTVEQLMEEDEQILKKTHEHEGEITDIGYEIQQLDAKIKHLTELSEKDKGVPVVKVSGKIFPGTIVSGPHSSFTIKKPYQNVNIFETKTADAISSQEWTMRISGLR